MKKRKEERERKKEGKRKGKKERKRKKERETLPLSRKCVYNEISSGNSREKATQFRQAA